jgi:epoxide hydrolase 4
MVKWWPGTAKKGTFSIQEIQLYKSIWSKPGVASNTLAWYRDIPNVLFRLHTFQDTPIPWGGIPNDVPVRSMWGSEDVYLPVEVGEGAKYFVPHLEFEVVEGATHWIQHEHPSLVNSRIMELLSRARW